ncbi:MULTISPECIES: mycofactocin system transcriptional regulator [Parafrankia]|uniref:Mycofactocin system transcriptional regulator n=1 Tax=Parafrankia colletiae TaxID=573497 RepID=A0A1S1R657_9ACTN|nr:MULTISPECIES: mycofactocin system transcriptional regulator [Parafrankia]MCK9904681.1 mycofactocin system transcriptional regulator [Frankia sp. Cpl3]OHV40224.1 mycofactocin system transcriptional regulator [Parafrankia colletiae]
MADLPRRPKGRPPVTDHGAIERAAFAAFAERGFDATTLDAIAQAAGIGRRTLLRYYPSKNDIPWGRFDESLAGLQASLEAMPHDIPVFEAVHRAVLAFNLFPTEAIAQHRQRMILLLRTPALQAHSALKYRQWREVIASYVAARHAVDPGDLLPRTVGQVTLALALSAYEQWLDHEDGTIGDFLDEALSGLRLYFADQRP